MKQIHGWPQRSPCLQLARRIAISLGLWVVSGLSVLLHAAQAASTDACWTEVSASQTAPASPQRVRLWQCANKALPEKLQGHLAARVHALQIETPDAIWIIDPGATRDQGLALLKGLKPDTGSARKLIIINSRPLAEHVMASDILMRQWPARRAQQLASPRVRELMQQRCVTCQQRLRRELGRSAMHGTLIRVPTAWPGAVETEGGDTNTGESAVAPFVAQIAQHAALDEDTWFVSRDGGWIWVGMLLSDQGIPDLQQGLVAQRLAVLDRFAQLDAKYPQTQWLGSLGRVSRERIAHERHYFQTWQARARQALDEGLSTLEALEKLRTMDSVAQAGNGEQRTLHELNLQRIIRQTEEAMFQ